MREFDPTNIYCAVLIYAQRRFSARHFAEEERRTDASPYSIKMGSLFQVFRMLMDYALYMRALGTN